MLDARSAQERAEQLLSYYGRERTSLDEVALYWRGRQPLPVVPTSVPAEVQRMAKMSRVNLIAPIVSDMAQLLYVDGFRLDPSLSDDDAPAWRIWQANRMDAHQTGIHRAALAFGTCYAIVLPGDPVPVIRGASPRALVAAYNEDSRDWPMYALEVVRSPWDPTVYRLYDDEAVYTLTADTTPELLGAQEHGLEVCPVVRFRNMDTLDEPPLSTTQRGLTEAPTFGEVEPLMPLQDQIDLTTFNLLVAQHFQSFRQRYVIGWVAESEQEKAKAGAARLWTFDDADIKVGEFGQVDLKGYLDSRESTVEQAGVLSQTPSHELLGRVVNLSAEALVASQVAQGRKRSERSTMFGESWEQVFWIASRAAGLETSEESQVRWRDTEPRSLSQTIDALGKMATMLQIPPEELWERIPGVSQQDVERYRASAGANLILAAATGQNGGPPPEAETVNAG